MKETFVVSYGDLERRHFWHLARRRIVASTIARFLPAGSFARPRLLDAGCGAGTNLAFFAARDFECVGLEPNATLARQARTASGVPVWHEQLPFQHIPDERFDVILLLDVLEHVEDDHAALASLKHLLKPAGIIIINVPAHPHLWSSLDEENQHFRRYTKASLSTLLAATGYRIRLLRFWGSLGYPFVFIQRRIVWPWQHAAYSTYTPPEVINDVFSTLLWWEFLATDHAPLPFGVSLLAVVDSLSSK